jgi:hypothetical protein
MIDVLLILFTGSMAIYVIVRAAMLDRVEPWYEHAPREPISLPETPPAFADRGLKRSAGRGRAHRAR